MHPMLKLDLVYLTLKFLNEQGHTETARMLERESGIYFHMEYFEEMVLSGQWEAAERYLSGFTKYDDDRYSRKIYFEMRKQNFLEKLDGNDRAMALDILMRDLKVFAEYDEELFKEMTQLLTLSNIRENRFLSGYKDTLTARAITMAEVKKIIQANPVFQGKLRFPEIENRRLEILINQGLNWQHHLCLHPQPFPQIYTLLTDHVCGVPGVSVSRPLLLQSSTPSSVPHSVAPTAVIGVPSGEGEEAEKCGAVDMDEVTSAAPTLEVDKVREENIPEHEPTDLPTIVIKTFNAGAFVTSIEFHPTLQSLLLVGTKMGDIGIWEALSGDRIFSRNFNVWNIGPCSTAFQTSMSKGPQVSVNRVTWSPDGSLFGAAFSKHLVQLYSYLSDTEIKQHLEIDAHAGAVTDLAFTAPDEHLLLITGGDDKIVKVWDAVSGEKKFSLVGHSAAICSVCPHSKDDLNFLFSTSADGNIKGWLYNEHGARLNYHAPALGHTTMAYSDNCSRLFSCGSNGEGKSFLVEWDQTEVSVKRTYKGLVEDCSDVLKLSTANNKYLAVGDDYKIKFWHMDHDDLLRTINAGGGLPARAIVRFNKEGSLLAVVAFGCSVRILGSSVGTDLIPQRQEAAHAISSHGVQSETSKKNEGKGNLTISDPGRAEAAEESPETDRDSRNQEEMEPEDFVDEEDLSLKFYHAYEPSHCLCLQISSDLKNGKISRLVYTNSGKAILALKCDGNNLLWKWQHNDLNPTGMATPKVSPRLRQPKGGQLMKNHSGEIPISKVIPCFALSRNDAYLVSASGGTISLYNTYSFKTITTFLPPLPSPACIAFYPRDNNILAIGMDNATIVIYNVRDEKIITKLEGHLNRVTGLTFSAALDVLVSSGGDLQIIQWEVEGWTMKKAALFQPPSPSLPPSWFDTTVQFDKDQSRFLAVNSTKLAIYDGKDLGLQATWPHAADFPGPVFSAFGDYTTEITNAVFSCDGRMIYAGFSDGSVGVFETKRLDLAYQISEAAYIPQPMTPDVFLTVVAAHPNIPTQFAAGLSDGRVYIVEPAPGDVTVWTELALDEKDRRVPSSAYCDCSSST